MHLFLPYSIFHSFCFLIFNFVAIYYRRLLTNLAEPYFSAMSGFFFIPMYFTAIAPWILYGILQKTERGRQNSTQSLISLERQANSVYFNALREQWKW
ncbi:unnamed protein product, partial [Mesorhabditis belari]|uniref:Uncharacterized protein n=1 Tax=Mesorhabditis belari TaxID=2138241 RepID=A0AAF3J828_9BILA